MTGARAMTAGEAMYRAACDALDLDPDARGSATRLHKHCADLCMLGQLSEWRRGRYAPRPATVEAFGARFGFELVQTWSWHATTDRPAGSR
jgi:hypothetical protein